jgi:ribosomal protein S18 acetylase RimI-like enzyme
MYSEITLNDISIRTDLRPGDIGYVTYLHALLYHKEYKFGISFEAYVAKGLYEFYEHYDPLRDRVWVCEYQNKIIGFLLLLHRADNAAQLRYFILEPAYRGIGLGKKMMQLYMGYLQEAGYQRSYLWTTNEQGAAALLYKRAGFVLTEEKSSEAFGKPLIEQKYELRRVY